MPSTNQDVNGHNLPIRFSREEHLIPADAPSPHHAIEPRDSLQSHRRVAEPIALEMTFEADTSFDQPDRAPLESSTSSVSLATAGENSNSSDTLTAAGSQQDSDKPHTPRGASGSPRGKMIQSKPSLDPNTVPRRPLKRTRLVPYRKNALRRGTRTTGLGLAEGSNTNLSPTHSTSSGTQVGEEREPIRPLYAYENGYHVCNIQNCGERFLNAAIMLAHLSDRHGHTVAPASSSLPDPANALHLFSDEFEPYYLPPESEDEQELEVVHVLHPGGYNERVVEGMHCDICGGSFKVCWLFPSWLCCVTYIFVINQNLAAMWQHRLQEWYDDFCLELAEYY